MIEKQIMDALEGVAAGGIYFDSAPEGTPLPYVTISGVGGNVISFLEGRARERNPRIQIDVFAAKRSEANKIMDAAAAIVCDGVLNAEQLGEPFSAFDNSVATYRRSCDFSFWCPA
ncbi:DUF3168 domain-containing protein [Collimonas sp. NPDC087041]|uniref:tail completion protein gp17 n=1 Tax=Collimonas sp. NPDC087041 TaxID=3363960 RepID=UPI0037F4EA9C